MREGAPRQKWPGREGSREAHNLHAPALLGQRGEIRLRELRGPEKEGVCGQKNDHSTIEQEAFRRTFAMERIITMIFNHSRMAIEMLCLSPTKRAKDPGSQRITGATDCENCLIDRLLSRPDT